MKTIFVSFKPHFFFIVLFFLTIALVAHVVTKEQGPHNGELKKTGGYVIEMKCIEKKFSVYLLDKKLKTLSNEEMTANVDFLFPDSTTMNMVLRPEGKEAFVCEVPSDFFSCKVNFNRQGKAISAKFGSPVKIVKQ